MQNPRWLVILVTILLLTVTMAAYAVYFLRFGAEGIGNQGHFGQFGDFVGGVLNPLLSAFTVVFLVWSVRLQNEELKHSTEALRHAAAIHMEQKEMDQKEYERRQLEEFARHYIDRIDELYSSPSFKYEWIRVGRALSPEATWYSIRELAFTAPERRGEQHIKFLRQIENPLATEVDPIVRECIQQIKEAHNVLFEVIAELMPLLTNLITRMAWKDRWASSLMVAELVGILDSDTAAQRSAILSLGVVAPNTLEMRNKIYPKQ